MNVAGVAAFASAAAALLGSLALAAVGRTAMRAPIVGLVAVALGVLAIAMLGWTFATEGYTSDGRTVWQVSNGLRRLLLLVAVILAGGGTTLAVVARRRRRLTPLLPLATLLIVFVDYLAFAYTVE